MKWIITTLMFSLAAILGVANAQQYTPDSNDPLNDKQRSMVTISSYAAQGDLSKLKTELTGGLDAGLTVNQIKESLVHLHAYCGFPRSLRGLQTFMQVLEERKQRGLVDPAGKDASPIKDDRSKYERGTEILGNITKMPPEAFKGGYAEFAPEIEVFLKEHLFADLFERDVLTYAERQLVTVSVLSTFLPLLFRKTSDFFKLGGRRSRIASISMSG